MPKLHYFYVIFNCLMILCSINTRFAHRQFLKLYHVRKTQDNILNPTISIVVILYIQAPINTYNYTIGTLNVMLKNFYLMLNNDMKIALRGLVFCDYNRFVYATAPPILIQTELDAQISIFCGMHYVRLYRYIYYKTATWCKYINLGQHF